MSDRLFVQYQGETVRVLNLEMSLLSVGRTPDNGLALRDPSVAIRHAEVRLLSGQFVITDLGNGETYMAGRRLMPFQPQVLAEGALIQIGPYVLAYAPGQDTPPDVPEPEPAPDLNFAALPLAPARTPWPARPETKPASAYLDYLPALYTESDFLGRYLLIFETLWEPLQRRQEHIEMYFAPGTAPAELLDWLSSWLGLAPDPHWPESRKRLWVREAMSLLRWRGTPYGLRRIVELGCGVTPLIEEDAARPYHVRVLLPDPEPAGLQDVTRDSARQLIARHMPAHVLYEIVFVPAPVTN
jgi:phage tail-like protein